MTGTEIAHEGNGARPPIARWYVVGLDVDVDSTRRLRMCRASYLSDSVLVGCGDGVLIDVLRGPEGPVIAIPITKGN